MSGDKMAKLPIKRKKHSKLTIALLSPILMVIFIAGWSLAWIGQSRKPKTKQTQKSINNTPQEEELNLIFIPNQEEQIRAK